MSKGLTLKTRYKPKVVCLQTISLLDTILGSSSHRLAVSFSQIAYES
jgi:hypothetical protein